MKIKTLVESFLLGLMWGPSYMLIKIALEEASPISIVTGRVTLAAIILFLIVKWTGRAFPSFGKVWGHLFFMGLVGNSLPFFFFAFGEQHITSALAGIINGVTPIMVAVLAHYLVPDERATFQKMVGVSFGFIGFVILLLPTVLDGTLEGDTVGIASVGMAATCYAVGIIYARKFLPCLPPVVAPASQLLTSALYLIPLSLYLEGPSQFFTLSWSTTAAIAGLGLMGTAAAFVLYYRILHRSGANAVSMGIYLTPIFGTFFGVLFLNEELGLHVYVAAGMILVGMMIVNGALKLPEFSFSKIKTPL
ncbi:MAG: drug/metabolite transporter (DMT)-like permease [Halioglobus sp.]|jgi:drug/metabolite transporter (DMT)-like permease